MRRILVIAALAASLVGCASETDAPPPAPAPPTITPAPAPTPTRSDDRCGLAQAKKLVGKNRSEIPVPVNPSLQRVACSTCPVTMDFNPNRLNFIYDAETGVVKEVKCG